MAFAKLFGGNEAKDEEQIVVLLKSGDDGPEVRFYFNPGGDFGVCNIKMKFSDSDDGWDAAEAWMKTVKESDARELVDRTRENLLQASPGDDGEAIESAQDDVMDRIERGDITDGNLTAIVPTQR